MIYEQERIAIIKVCLMMQEIGFFLGTWGNVSVRIENNILLTPSRIEYDTMRPEDMVVIDIDGNKVAGERNPTSEKEVHRQIYLVRDDVRAVIHAHTKNAMSVSATRLKSVPCLVEEMSQLLGGEIPLAEKYIPAEQHFELGIEAARAIGSCNGVILRNHGPVSCGRTLNEAVLVSKVIEKACDIYLSAAEKHLLVDIPKKYADSERHRYLHTYGNEKT